MAPARALLRDAHAHQLRDRRRDGTRAGVPVRDELVDLLGVRGGRLRRPARDRGTCGVHARVDVPRSLDLRLGPPLEARAPRDDLDLRARLVALGVLHHRRELVDATAGRVDDHQRARRADGCVGADVEPARDRRLYARGSRRAHDRLRGGLRDRVLAHRAQAESGALPARREAGAHRRSSDLGAQPRRSGATWGSSSPTTSR